MARTFTWLREKTTLPELISPLPLQTLTGEVKR